MSTYQTQSRLRSILIMNKYIQQINDELNKNIQSCILTGIDHFNEKLLHVLQKVPRESFIPKALKHKAYDNTVLPLGHGQNMSQPYIVALMTELMQIKEDDIILEVGTGSGYQSAILSMLCKQVYTIEQSKELSEAAQQRFEQLNYNNINVFTGNGYEGLPEHAPYSGIIVTAAATHIPDALLNQLKADGLMVIPVGLYGLQQQLLVVKKTSASEIELTDVQEVNLSTLINVPGNASQSFSNYENI